MTEPDVSPANTCWIREVPRSVGNASSHMSHEKQSTGKAQPRSGDPVNGTRRVCIDQKLSPHHSPLLKLLPLAPNNEFTKQLRERLRLVEFQQGIRRDLYGEAAAEEYPIGHTPDALREEARASHSMYDSSSGPSSPRSLDDEHRCEATATPARGPKARRGREHPTQLSLPETIEKRSRLNHPEAYHIWLSPPSSSCTDSTPNATAGEGSRAPKRKRLADDGTVTTVSRRSTRLRGESLMGTSS